MWVFEHCVLKTRCEAVVEGMGSVVNLHANGRRGLTAVGEDRDGGLH